MSKAFVRPHLEYASAVWCPKQEKDIATSDVVQRRAMKFVQGLANLSYEERLRVLQLPTLGFRRLLGEIIETYKIMTTSRHR
jgi:hypothetical protein